MTGHESQFFQQYKGKLTCDSKIDESTMLPRNSSILSVHLTSGSSFNMSCEEVEKKTTEKIGDVLRDQTRPLKERFRALFTLRNLKGNAAVECIARAFSDPSALLKHECAYCLGQMQNRSAIPILESILDDVNQDCIVRHEAGT